MEERSVLLLKVITFTFTISRPAYLNNNYDPSSCFGSFCLYHFWYMHLCCGGSALQFLLSLSEGSPTAYGNIYYSLDGGPWTQFGLALIQQHCRCGNMWTLRILMFSDVGSLAIWFSVGRMMQVRLLIPNLFRSTMLPVVGNYSRKLLRLILMYLSVSPNPVCQGSFVTFEYQLSDTLCDGNYEIELIQFVR
jgi:hypothetical protein